MIAYVTLGYYRNIEEAYEKMLGNNSPAVFEPNEDAVAKSRKTIERKHKLYDALNECGVYKVFSE